MNAYKLNEGSNETRAKGDFKTKQIRKKQLEVKLMKNMYTDLKRLFLTVPLDNL